MELVRMVVKCMEKHGAERVELEGQIDRGCHMTVPIADIDKRELQQTILRFVNQHKRLIRQGSLLFADTGVIVTLCHNNRRTANRALEVLCKAVAIYNTEHASSKRVNTKTRKAAALQAQPQQA